MFTAVTTSFYFPYSKVFDIVNLGTKQRFMLFQITNEGEALTSSKMFEEAEINEATDELVYNVAMNEGGFSEN